MLGRRLLRPKRKLYHRSARGFAKSRVDVRTVEETYVKKSPIEHILLRPDLYVGPVQIADATLWTPVPRRGSRRRKNGVARKMVMKEQDVAYSPALLKIFDEVIVNAVDNVSRGGGTTRIEVTRSRAFSHSSVPATLLPFI